MGSGGSKKNLEPEFDRNRRPSQHELTNPPPQSLDLVMCDVCTRKFASDRIDRHKEICSKTNTKKREEFDIREKRIEGTEAEDFKDVKPLKLGEKADWKKTHTEMMEALREAKKHRPKSAVNNDPEIHILT